MPKLTPADEFFYHQIPEPLPNVVTHHPFWRESLFFIMHPREELGDTIVLTMAQFPRAEIMDAMQLGIKTPQPLEVEGRQLLGRNGPDPQEVAELGHRQEGQL